MNVNDVDLTAVQNITNGIVDIVSTGNIYLNNLETMNSLSSVGKTGSDLTVTASSLFAGKLKTAGNIKIGINNKADLSSLTLVEDINVYNTIPGTQVDLTLPSSAFTIKNNVEFRNVFFDNLRIQNANTVAVIGNSMLTRISANTISNSLSVVACGKFQALDWQMTVSTLTLLVCPSFLQWTDPSIKITKALTIHDAPVLTHISGFYSDPASTVEIDINLDKLPALGSRDNGNVIINFRRINNMYIKNTPAMTTLNLSNVIYAKYIWLQEGNGIRYINMGIFKDCQTTEIIISSTATSTISIYYTNSPYRVDIRADILPIKITCDANTYRKQCPSNVIVAVNQPCQ